MVLRSPARGDGQRQGSSSRTCVLPAFVRVIAGAVLLSARRLAAGIYGDMGHPVQATSGERLRKVRSLALGLLLAGGLLLALRTDNHLLGGGLLTALGATCLVQTFRQPGARFRREWGSTAGPGWWLGWLISKSPAWAGRTIAAVLSLGITVLGVAILLGF